MTNRERILQLIRSELRLTDGEIRRRTGIEPHQQVNQICRGLAADGQIRRIVGAHGHIVNVADVDSAPIKGECSDFKRLPSVKPAVGSSREPIGERAALPQVNLAKCLFIMPCSGAKKQGRSAGGGASIADQLPQRLAEELLDRRIKNEQAVELDESMLRPAVDRYDGHFYDSGRAAISRLRDAGSTIVILSGGYGLVLAHEMVGMYNGEFRPSLWPGGLVERCLSSIAADSGATQVVGVLSATTGYAKVFRRTEWPATVENVYLVTPQSTTGAMVKAPRAQGEALDAIAETGRLASDWTSTDGLGIDVNRA